MKLKADFCAKISEFLSHLTLQTRIEPIQPEKWLVSEYVLVNVLFYWPQLKSTNLVLTLRKYLQVTRDFWCKRGLVCRLIVVTVEEDEEDMNDEGNGIEDDKSWIENVKVRRALLTG
jgi:hypothetical protein